MIPQSSSQKRSRFYSAMQMLRLLACGLLPAKSVTCRSWACSRTVRTDVEYLFRVNSCYAASASPYLHKIYQGETDWIARAFKASDSVESAADFVVSCELESVSDPNTCFRGCSTDVQRDYLSRLGETSIVFCRYCACHWSGLDHPGRLIDGLLVGDRATV